MNNMKHGWPLLILLLILNLSAVSQSGKCFQTVQLNCGDTIVDYLTANEKKNLLRLQLILEQKVGEIEHMHVSGKVDSLQIAQLNSTVNSLTTQVTLALQAKHYSDSAYTHLYKAYRKLQREMHRAQIRLWLSTALGAAGAFGAGVGTAFIILKTQ